MITAEPKKEIHLYHLAANLIRSYVLRGDSYESLKSSCLSVSRDCECCQIGGYLLTPGDKLVRLKADDIGVRRGDEWAVFSLRTIYDDIEVEIKIAPSRL